VRAFDHVFSDRSYDLTRFPQHRRIDAAFRDILDSGRKPVIVDCGANVGASACWFALQYPEAEIVAIEPDPENAALCRKNVQRYGNVRVVEAAVGSSAGHVQLFYNGRAEGTRAERSGGGVAIITVPEAIRLAGEDTALLIAKIDIEGFESDLFERNTEWAETAPVVMIELHDWRFPGQRTSKNALRVLSATDHEIVVVGGDTLAFVR
jgi:FkbM family methyltransferase